MPTPKRLDGLRAGLIMLILIAAIALFFVGRIPKRQPGSEPAAVANPGPVSAPVQRRR